MLSTEIDTGKHYRVTGYRGIAWYCEGPVMVRDEDYEWSGIEDPDPQMVRMVMVGDDRVFEVDVDDIEILGESEFCHSCGQIGCGHDVREEE